MKRLIPMAVALLLSVTACTKEDVTPYDPEGTAGLNMMFESYGGTLLDGTDIYIDDAQNFVSGYFRMAYMGPVAGLSSMNRHLLNNLTGSAAVEVGGGYMIYDSDTLHTFSSGVTAIESGSTYLLMRVESMITSTEGQTEGAPKTVGARVRYVSARAGGYGVLPDHRTEFDTDHGVFADANLFNAAEEIECSYNVECFKDGNGEWVIGVRNAPGTIRLRIRDSFAIIDVI